MINVRRANINDAEFLSQFMSTLDRESQYLLYDPGERTNEIETIKNYLYRMSNCDKSAVFIAEDQEGNITGFVCGEVSHLNRISYVMKVNIGVLRRHHGDGTGRVLSKKIIDYAQYVGIVRIEATVIKQNKISLNLCKKFGFEVEAIKKNSIKIGNELYDEYLLAKLFSA